MLGCLSDVVARRLGRGGNRSHVSHKLPPAASPALPVASGPSTIAFGTPTSASISVTKYGSRTASTVSGGVNTTAAAGAYCFEAKLADLGLGVRISTERGALVRRRTAVVGSGNEDGEVCGVRTGILQATTADALREERAGRGGRGGGPSDGPGSPRSLGQELLMSSAACMEYRDSLGSAGHGERRLLPFLGVVVAGRDEGEDERPGASGAEGVHTLNPSAGSPILHFHGLEALQPGRGNHGFGGGGRGCSGGGGVNAESRQGPAIAPAGCSAAVATPARGAMVPKAVVGVGTCGADGAPPDGAGGHGRSRKGAGLGLPPFLGKQLPPGPYAASAAATVASLAAVGSDLGHSQGVAQQLQCGKGQVEQDGQDGTEGRAGAGVGAEAEAEAEAEEHQVLHLLTPSATRLLALPSLQRRERGSSGYQGQQLQQRPSDRTSLNGAPQLLFPAASAGLRTRSSGKPQAASLLPPPSDSGTARDVPHLPPSPFLAFARKLTGGGAILNPGADSAHTSITSRDSHPFQGAPSHGVPAHGTPSLSIATPTPTPSTASRGSILASGSGLPAKSSTKGTDSSAHSGTIRKLHSSGGGPGGVAAGRTGEAATGGFAGEGPCCKPLAFPFDQPFYNNLADPSKRHHYLPTQHHRYGLAEPPGGCCGKGLGTIGLGLACDGVEAAVLLPPIQVG